MGTRRADQRHQPGALTGWINRAKTWYRWQALPLTAGAVRWTSPTGIVTDRPATQIGPTDTEQREAAARLRQPSPGLARRAANQARIDEFRAEWATHPNPPHDDPPPF